MPVSHVKQLFQQFAASNSGHFTMENCPFRDEFFFSKMVSNVVPTLGAFRVPSGNLT
jgi:hypothetical protein